MITSFESPQLRVPTINEGEVRASLRHYLTQAFPPPRAAERRSARRFPYPFLMHVTPVDRNTLEPTGEKIVVAGKDLTDRGIGFYHPRPLPERWVKVTLTDAGGRQVSLLVELEWCRFTTHGWYDSGGRFLRRLEAPAA